MKTTPLKQRTVPVGGLGSCAECRSLSADAKARMERTDGEPLFLADWSDVVMAHFEVDPKRLQRLTPFTLDLLHGRAFVSLVVFHMDRMRLRILPGLTEPLFAPFTRSWFLNLRTYVRNGDETGIQFLVEWLSNRLSVPFGGPVYGLPYRAGHFDLRQHFGVRHICVKPLGGDGRFEGEFEALGPDQPCEPGSETEFLMERYTAFTDRGGRRRRFRIWHPAWQQRRCRVVRCKASILGAGFPELSDARLIGATCSAGVDDVWMGRPQSMN